MMAWNRGGPDRTEFYDASRPDDDEPILTLDRLVPTLPPDTPVHIDGRDYFIRTMAVLASETTGVIVMYHLQPRRSTARA
jgi:hypothetical protein